MSHSHLWLTFLLTLDLREKEEIHYRHPEVNSLGGSKPVSKGQATAIFQSLRDSASS